MLFRSTNDTGLLFSIVGDLNSSCWAVGLSSPERQATNHKTMDYAIYGETDKRILFMRRGVEVNAQGQPTGTYAGYTVPQATGPNSVLALERQNGAVVARLNGTVVCTWKLSEAEANAPFVFNLSLGKHLLVNKGYDQLDGSGGHLNMTVANLRFINPALNKIGRAHV